MWFARTVFAFMLVCAALAATPARADYNRSQKWFNGLSEWERKGVQTNLILGGYYSGLADGRFGRNTYAALVAFEDQFSLFPNGILNRLEADMLVSAAREWAENYQLREARDERAGIAFPVPYALVDRHRPTDRGGVWTSGAFEIETAAFLRSEVSIAALYDAMAQPSAAPGLEYKFLGSDFFVLSGEENRTRYYSYYRENGRQISGFSVSWASALQSRAARLPVYIVARAKFFQPARAVPRLVPEGGPAPVPAPVPAGPRAPYVPPAAPPDAPADTPTGSSSGSGFFVSANGLILTNHHVVDRCATIEVPGHGRAELLRNDTGLDLAAILVRRPPAAQRTAVFDDTPAVLGSRVVAGGFPLSQLLNNSFTLAYGQVTMRGGMAMNRRDFAISAALQPGNSGGAVVNDRGKVVGIAVAKFDDAKLIESVGTTGANFSFAIDALYARDFLRPFTLELNPAAAGAGQPLRDEDLAASLESYSVQVLCRR